MAILTDPPPRIIMRVRNRRSVASSVFFYPVFLFQTGGGESQSVILMAIEQFMRVSHPCKVVMLQLYGERIYHARRAGGMIIEPRAALYNRSDPTHSGVSWFRGSFFLTHDSIASCKVAGITAGRPQNVAFYQQHLFPLSPTRPFPFPRPLPADPDTVGAAIEHLETLQCIHCPRPWAPEMARGQRGPQPPSRYKLMRHSTFMMLEGKKARHPL